MKQVFEKAGVVPEIILRSELARPEDLVDDTDVHERMGDDFFYYFQAGCHPGEEVMGLTIGFPTTVASCFFRYDASTGGYLSAYLPRAFTHDAARGQVGTVLLLKLSNDIDRYLRANLGSWKAVLAHREWNWKHLGPENYWAPEGAQLEEAEQ